MSRLFHDAVLLSSSQMRTPPTRPALSLLLAASVVLAARPLAAQTPVKAQIPANITPAWNKGIQPISQESYWNAIECGKQGGARPACVFYDAEFCKNPEFTLALYTPYKTVAYAVWQAVSQKREPPTPSYAEAQRTRVVLGVRPLHGAKNPVTGVTVRRSGRVVKPATQTLDGGAGTFIFDFPAFAPTSAVTIEVAGRARTISCVVDRAVLARMR